MSVSIALQSDTWYGIYGSTTATISTITTTIITTTSTIDTTTHFTFDIYQTSLCTSAQSVLVRPESF